MSQDQEETPMDVQNSGDGNVSNNADDDQMDYSSPLDQLNPAAQQGALFSPSGNGQGSFAGVAEGQNPRPLTTDEQPSSWIFVNAPGGGVDHQNIQQQHPRNEDSAGAEGQNLTPLLNYQTDVNPSQFHSQMQNPAVMQAAQIYQSGDGQQHPAVLQATHIGQQHPAVLQATHIGQQYPAAQQPFSQSDPSQNPAAQQQLSQSGLNQQIPPGQQMPQLSQSGDGRVSSAGVTEDQISRPPPDDVKTPDNITKQTKYIDLKLLEQHLPGQKTMQTGDDQQHLPGQQTTQTGDAQQHLPGQKTTHAGDAQASSSSVSHGHKATASDDRDSPISSVKNKDPRPTTQDLMNPNKPADKTQSEEDTSAVGDNSQSTAPPDIGTFIIKVDWKETFPDKWRAKLQKALQTWLSSLEGTPAVHNLKIMEDQSCALVEITPPTDVFKNGCFITLKFKHENNKEVTAQLYLEKTYSGSLNTSMLDKNEASSSKVNSEAEDANNSTPIGTTAFSLPLYQYWYMHHAYRKELERIEKNHGVSIKTEVSVSINTRNSSVSLTKASEDFQNLVCESINSFSDATISHSDMDSDTVKGILRTIQSEKERMMFTKSAHNCLIFGPRKYTNMLKCEVKPMRSENEFSGSLMDVDNNDSPHSKPTLVMSTQGLPTQLEVDKVYWDLMKLSYEEQLSQLEAKYGVSFDEDKLQKNVIKAQSGSRGVQHLNLERHAVSALTQLYQKLASAAMICELRNPADQDEVAAVVEKLKQRYCVVTANGVKSWRLAGLPEHLGPAIAEIEKTLKKQVFDEKMKKSIGYSGDIPHARGIRLNQMPDYGAGAVGGAERDDGENFRGGKETDSKGSSGQDSKDAPAEEEMCAICMDSFTDKERLKCGHEFCRDCLKQSVESMGSICPICKEVFGKLEGNQPEGTMRVSKARLSLHGYPHCGSIEIDYDIPSGIQTDKHPNPGKPYYGTTRQAYLPDNREGNEVVALLQRAFQQKLIFTVGTSTTTGRDNAVTWNDIHHKTSRYGGPQSYGYPDPDYLKRVKDELKAKGIE